MRARQRDRVTVGTPAQHNVAKSTRRPPGASLSNNERHVKVRPARCRPPQCAATSREPGVGRPGFPALRRGARSHSRVPPGLRVISPQQIDFPDGAFARALEVTDVEDLPSAVGILGLEPPRPTVVIVGGAGGLDEADIDRLRPIFTSGIVPVLERYGAAAVDGGTLAGVMRLCGEARASHGASFPLVGVAAAGTVQRPGRPAPPDGAALEPHHSHFLIVPGDESGGGGTLDRSHGYGSRR